MRRRRRVVATAAAAVPIYDTGAKVAGGGRRFRCYWRSGHCRTGAFVAAAVVGVVVRSRGGKRGRGGRRGAT